jgi:hypothetical protein
MKIIFVEHVDEVLKEALISEKDALVPASGERATEVLPPSSQKGDAPAPCYATFQETSHHLVLDKGPDNC